MSDQKHLGKICPYCKTPFAEDDDVVFCDRCEMPHHTSCWIENQGCTTFGCDGTIRSDACELQDSRLEAGNTDDFTIELYPDGLTVDLSSSYCPKCGSVHEPNDVFCKHCGNHFITGSTLKPQYNSDASQRDAAGGSTYIQDEHQILVEKVIGTNTEYYLPVFTKFRDQSTNTSWNWSAFLFTPYWCFYRKMYAVGIVVFVAVLISNFLNLFWIILLWVGRIIFGVYANHIYYNRIVRKTDERIRLQKSEVAQYLKENSGVSYAGVVVGAIIYGVIIALIRL